MARRTHAGRILGHDEALLTDPMQQRGMPGRVWDVDAAGEHSDGEPVGGERCAVRGTVDAVGAARHHRDVPLDETGRQVRGDVFAIGGACPGSDDRDRALSHLIEAARTDGPQCQWRVALRPQAVVDAGEGGEGKQRPLGVIGRDQPAIAASQ